MSKFLNKEQIDNLADNAVTAYEVNCSWTNTKRSIRENIEEEYGFKPSLSLVLLISKVARVKWMAIGIKTKKIIEKDGCSDGNHCWESEGGDQSSGQSILYCGNCGHSVTNYF